MAGFFPYQTGTFGGVVPTFKGKAPASTAIAVGDALTIDSDGYYALMASAGQCDGVAASAVASGSAGQDLAIWPSYLTFKVQTETTAPAQTDVGEQVDISTATTGAFKVNPGASSNDDFFVKGIVYDIDPAESGTPAIGDSVFGIFVDTENNQ